MPISYLAAVACEDQKVNPLFCFLGARLTLVEDGRACITMPAAQCLRQGGGMIAGGILATLADEAMAHAVLSALPEDHFTVTAEMNIRYLRAADPSRASLIKAKASVVKLGRTLCVAEASVIDQNDRQLAVAGGTFFVKAP
ncbi:PaaI family thioesterase [Desulfovibrio sp. OttesenSCG-928-A18]|nr:PaaI family thioesterase [Desulfovibrio sp. OttesenSCG-928-A18]